MAESQFKPLLEAANKAKIEDDRARVESIANQMLSIANGAWEKGEARSLLAWAQGGSVAGTGNGMQAPADPARVTVVNFDIEFGSLVWLMVKAAIAAIPALVILAVIAASLAAVVGFLVSI